MIFLFFIQYRFKKSSEPGIRFFATIVIVINALSFIHLPYFLALQDYDSVSLAPSDFFF